MTNLKVNWKAREWFTVLARRHDERAPRLEELRSYTNGNPPLPETGAAHRKTWQQFQKRACLDLGGLIVSSAANRIRYAGVVIGDERTDLEKRVGRILRDNRFESVLSDAVTWALIDGESYLQTAASPDGKPVITAESAQHVTVAADPLNPEKPRAALKVWRDEDLGCDFAFVWDGTERVQFARPIKNKKQEVITQVRGGAWEEIATQEVGRVPFVIIRPRSDGLGCFESHTGVIDRVHLGILHRLSVQAMQAYRQRAIKGDLPEEDADGNPFDPEKVFQAAPGALWELPDGIDIWESQVTDINQLLGASKTDLRDLAAVTRTALSNLNPSDGANQSAESARNAKEGEISRVIGYLERITPAVELAIVRLLEIAAPGELREDETVTVLFKPPQVIGRNEQVDALIKVKGADIPWRTRMMQYGGFSSEEVDRMELELAAEQLSLAAFGIGPQEPAPSAPRETPQEAPQEPNGEDLAA